MSNLSQYLSSLPAGAIIQSPANIADPNWLRCDGSAVSRAVYPALSAVMGAVGAFTPTIRTLAVAPTNAGIATNGTTVIASGNASAPTQLQSSTNGGATWTPVGAGNNFAYSNLIWNGTVFLATTASANAGSYSANGTTGWTTVASATYLQWAATNPANGTIVAISTSQTNQVVISTNASVPAFTTCSLAAGTGASVQYASQIVWTGTQFMIFGLQGTGQGYQYSATGASGTWTGVLNPPWGASIISSAVSDGANNVLVCISGSSIAYASANGGTTWRQTLLPANHVAASTNAASYANGRWFISLINSNGTNLYTSGDMAVSSDLQSWTLVPVLSYMMTGANNQYATQVVYQGGNYILSSAGVPANGGSSINTATENTLQMYLPTSHRASSQAGFTNGAANYQEWIKAA